MRTFGLSEFLFILQAAQWTLALRWYRAAPQEGLEAARKAS